MDMKPYVEQVREGRAEAFEPIVRCYQQRIFHFDRADGGGDEGRADEVGRLRACKKKRLSLPSWVIGGDLLSFQGIERDSAKAFRGAESRIR